MIYTTLWTRDLQTLYKRKGGFDFQNSPGHCFWISTFQSLEMLSKGNRWFCSGPCIHAELLSAPKGKFPAWISVRWGHTAMTVTAGAAVKDWFTSQSYWLWGLQHWCQNHRWACDKTSMIFKSSEIPEWTYPLSLWCPTSVQSFLSTAKLVSMFQQWRYFLFPSVSLAFLSVSPKGSLSSLPRIWAIARLSSEELCYFNIVLVKYLSQNGRRRETSSQWY